MKLAIVEDNAAWMNKILEYIKDFFKNDTIEVEIDKYKDTESFLQAGKEYEIVCMDVEFKNKNGEPADCMDGIEAIQHYKIGFPDCIVGIVTVHKEWWRKGYQVEAYRYIYKGTLREDMQEMLQSAMMLLPMYRKMRFYVVGKEEVEIAYKDVIYIETDKRNVMIHTTKGRYINNRKIGDWEEELEKENFYRLHKSYLVNLKWVDQVETKEVLLYNGERILLSPKKEKEMWRRLIKWRLNGKVSKGD